MNHQFDVIIIGDSKEGNAAVKAIAGSNRKIKAAFISREFKSTTTWDFLNVEYIKADVVFIDYNKRLFCCYLDNGDRYYCTHLIIATGLKYAPFMVGNKIVPGVFNTTNEIPKTSKQQVAVVIGNKDKDIKLAMSIAKKYKYVYLCSSTMILDATDTLCKKLSNIENILIVPNSSVIKASFEENMLTAVTLDNYSKITCNAIFAITDCTPETSFISEKLISKENSYLKTTNTAQSDIVPKCFAIGNCACKSTKKMQMAMVETVLNDFDGG